jgi:hypothetical protein
MLTLNPDLKMPRSSAALHRRPVGDGSAVTSGPEPDRLATLEATVAPIQHTLDVHFARMAQMQQAQIVLMVSQARNGGDGADEH